MTSASVGPLCFNKSKIDAAIYQEILEHFMLPSADKLYGDADFIFQQDLITFPVSRPLPSGLLTMILLCLSGQPTHLTRTIIVLSRGRFIRPNIRDELKGAIKATWDSIMPQQCHRLIASMPRRIEAVIHAKGAPTKY